MSENITNKIAAGDLNPVPENPMFPEGLRVLVVDDDPAYLKILSVMLEKCKYQVTQTTNAAEALALLRKNKESYDIIMTDVKMPDMDGFELVKIIGLEMDIPVIMMSADGDINKVMKGVTYGARDYLVKPIRILELRNIWQHVVRKNMLVTEKSSKEKGRGNLPSKKRRGKSQENEDADADALSEGAASPKRRRFAWTQELHKKFVDAVNQLDVDKVVPKQIVEVMNEPHLTREIVASHLQKFRIYLKKQKEIMVEERSCNAGQKWSNSMLRDGNRCSSSVNGVMTYGDHLSNSQTFSNSQFNEGVMIGHPNHQQNQTHPFGFANFAAGQSRPSGFAHHSPYTLPSAEHALYYGPAGVFGTLYQTSVVQPFPNNALPGTNYRGFPTVFQANDKFEVAGQGIHVQQSNNSNNNYHMSSEDDEL